MHIKRYLLLILILLIFSSAVSAQISLAEFAFDIRPDKFSRDTYFILDELKNSFDFRSIELAEDGIFIEYDNDYYLLFFRENMVESSRGKINLKNPPLKINGHILVPGELLLNSFDLTDEFDDQQPEQFLNDLKANIYLKNRIIETNDLLEVTIEIINSSSSDQKLRFSSSQIYNIIIRDEDNNLVYSWDESKAFTQAFRNIEIEAQEALYLEEKISLQGLSSGDYYIMAEIKSLDQEMITKTKKFTLE